MKYKQEPPFCVQIEFTEGCNLYCNFCGLTGIRKQNEKNFKFMTPKVATRVAKSIAKAGWNARIEFAQHGEPTMNPDMFELVRIFRRYLPSNQLMMTSNGGGLLGNPIEKMQILFDMGLNVLAIDEYEYVKIASKIRASLTDIEIAKVDFDVYEYPHNREASPHKRWPKDTRTLILVQDISVSKKGNHSTLSNHSGAAFPLDYSKNGKKCAKPFREMAVHWDGHVKACCQDWFGVAIPGTVMKSDIEDIWHGELFTAMRKKLYHGQRDFPPCLGCNYVTYRNGLLPDQRGKLSLPKPTKKDNNVIKKYVNLSRPKNKAVSEVAKCSMKEWRTIWVKT